MVKLGFKVFKLFKGVNMQITITYDCDECNTEIEFSILNLNGKNKIPLFSLCQIEFACPKCGLKHYTGDIDVLNENKL
jgi:hypothetical protein